MAEFQGEVASLSFLGLKELSALGLGLLTAHGCHCNTMTHVKLMSHPTLKP